MSGFYYAPAGSGPPRLICLGIRTKAVSFPQVLCIITPIDDEATGDSQVKQLDPTGERDNTRRRQWLLGGLVCFCILLVTTLIVLGLLFQENPASDVEYTQSQLSEDTLGVANDELIMLIISLIVVIQIATSFKFLRRLPNRLLLLCSFVTVAFSAFFTVAESLVFPEVLNFLEHLSFMTAAILLAIWCRQVFCFNKQEDL